MVWKQWGLFNPSRVTIIFPHTFGDYTHHFSLLFIWETYLVVEKLIIGLNGLFRIFSIHSIVHLRRVLLWFLQKIFFFLWWNFLVSELIHAIDIQNIFICTNDRLQCNMLVPYALLNFRVFSFIPGNISYISTCNDILFFS